MAHMDIFRQDAFSLGQLTDTITRVPYSPGYLGSLNLFKPVPLRTPFFAIEEKDKTLAIIQTSQRGAPLEQGRTYKRRIRRFDTVRIAKGDRINSEEVAGIRAYGSETELMQVQQLVVEKQETLLSDLSLTREFHMLGAVQGKVLDADGSVIINWYDEFGITEPTAIDFGLNTATTDVEKLIRVQILRPMQKAAKGAWLPGSYAMALCGDEFFDKLTTHKTVRETYLNYQAAAQLRNKFGVAGDGPEGTFSVFPYGGVMWVNYRGADNFVDDGTGVAGIGINSDEAKIFPVGAKDIFQLGLSPGEGMENVNGVGRDVYSEMEIEKRTNPRYVELEIYSYPLYVCTRPEMLMKGTVTA